MGRSGCQEVLGRSACEDEHYCGVALKLYGVNATITITILVFHCVMNGWCDGGRSDVMEEGVV